MPTETAIQDFRAIIVGGGPVGVMMANFLQRAGIDFVLIEKRSTIREHTGAGLIMWPHTMRLFHQLGALKEIEKVGGPLYHTFNTVDGKIQAKVPLFKHESER
jgi:2-polyprenyl-6-methoxyphenol hydroxylase-like FAD-dependent oxidoreductase